MTMLPTNRPFAGLLGLQGTPWAGALAGLGSGLLSAGSGGNFGQGFTGGIQNWQQQMAERQRMQQDQELFDLRRQQMEAEQQAAAITQQQKDAQAEAVKKWVTSDPRVAPYADALMANPDAAYEMLAKLSEPVKPEGPQSGIGKIMADLNAGLIDQSTADALIKKETYIAPSAGSMPTERERNARAAGLVPGTPEYQQYLLGRDDTAPGPFQGTSMDAQAMNILLTGDPASPEYAAAYAQLAMPKVTFDPVTQKMVSVAPDMSWARRPAMSATTPNGQSGVTTTQVPGATITSTPGAGAKMTPEEATKFTAAQEGAKDIASAIEALAPDGKVNEMNVATGQSALGVQGVPFTAGRDARQKMRRGIEAILRAMTGAAAPDSEVMRYMEMFFPSPMDDDATAVSKLQAAQNWVTGIINQMKVGRPQLQDDGVPSGTDYESMYGLTPTN